MTATALAPDERALRQHLHGARFQAGLQARKWRLVSLEWPVAIIAVAATLRIGAPSEFAIRFHLGGYPDAAPTGSLWDVAASTHLLAAVRPKGDRVAIIFRCDGWLGGCLAMYAAWDRVGLQAHPEWAQRYPRTAWHAKRDLAFILENVHEMLNADDYLGV